MKVTSRPRPVLYAASAVISSSRNKLAVYCKN
jgi:hypothetical protein